MFSSSPSTDIDRHKSAIVRVDISRPVRLALDAGLFSEGTTFFDYGCGHGGDVQRLRTLNIATRGWDPFYFPAEPREPADIVNLGYVLNVVEDPNERRQALQEAWKLTKRTLVVSAQVLLNYLSGDAVAYADGVITKRNTFQKYFRQEELDSYIQETLGVTPVPAGLGIFFVFRDESAAEAFRASRFHSRRSTPAVQLRTKRYEDFEYLLKPLMDFVSDRGRLPLRHELAETEGITREFGSLNSAFNFIIKATNSQEWANITEKRKQDLLVYCALTQFTKRPRIGTLPPTVQQDIKVFFGSYKQACDIADAMLFSLGKPGIIAEHCKQSPIGKLLPDGLYVHISALNELDPILRLYEGCASRTIGRMDGATLVKFHTDKPKISYLFYPAFDEEAHPALHTSMRIDLRDLSVSVSDYAKSANPPILHRKETFVSPNYPLATTFKQLTEEEQRLGLFESAKTIGTRRGWEERLKELDLEIVGHRIGKVGTLSYERPPIAQPTEVLDTSTGTDSVLLKEMVPTAAAGNEKKKKEYQSMTFEELHKFVSSKMSISHVYQPGILLALMEHGGTASLEQCAEACSRLEGKHSGEYSSKLSKYPIQALQTHGVISTTGNKQYKLNCEWSSLPESQREQLKTDCLARWKRKQG